MPKHKHYDKIIAKAENMELVVFIKMPDCWSRATVASKLISFSEDYDYFLCLPKFESECLHWLNGGDVQSKPIGDLSNGFEYYWEHLPDSDDFEWSLDCTWMMNYEDLRIKPEIKKMWIGYFPDTNQTFPHPQDTQDLAEGYAAMHYKYPVDEWQFIEIEVEKKSR